MAKRGRPSSRASAPPPARPGGFDASVLRLAMVWLVGLKIAGLILVLDPEGFQAFDLPKSLFSRATAWALGGLIVAAYLRYGRSIVTRSRLHLAVAAFLGANLVSAALAEDRYTALFGDQARYLGVTFVVDMVVLYAAVAIAFRSPRDWLFAGGLFALGALGAIAYALIQYSGHDPVRWADDSRIRPFATLGNADMFGHFLSVVFAAGLGAVVFRRGRGERLELAAGTILAVAALATAAVVATRGSVLGVAGALVAAAAAYLRANGTRQTTLRVVALGAAGSALVLAVVLTATPLGERVRATVLEGVATRDRVLIYIAAKDELLARPLFGFGPDSFAVGYPRVRPVEGAMVLGLNTPQSSAHSWVLEAAATTGVVGLAATLALILCFGWTLFTRGLAADVRVGAPLFVALAAYWSNALVTVGMIGVDWIPWVIYGGTVALLGERASAASANARKAASVAPLLLSVAAAVFALSGLSALEANRDLQRARVAWTAKRADPAIAAAQAAVRADGGRADYWNWLGLALDLARRNVESREAYATAAAKAPYNATYWMNLARAEGRLALAGDQPSARRDASLGAAGRAIAADPNEPSWYQARGEIELAFDQSDAAADDLVRAISLYPLNDAWRTQLVQATTRMTDVAAARRRLEEANGYRDDAVLRVGIARLALKLNDVAGARANTRRAIELDPSNADAQALLRELGG